MTQQSLKESVFSTLAFFDILDLPLTAMEVFLYTLEIADTTFEAVITILREDARIGMQAGFYYIRGSEDLVLRRLSAYPRTFQKLKKVQRGLDALARIPTVRGVFLCNTTGYFNLSQEADVDVLIITKKGAVWVTRLCSLLITAFYGLRIRDGKVADKLCLSFFVDEENLSMQPFLESNDDIYLYYWVYGCIPYYAQAGLFEEFLKKNEWMREKTPRLGYKLCSSRLTHTLDASKIRIIASNVLQLGEKFAQRLQWARFSEQKKQKAQEENTHVVISDSVLKFHDADKRDHYTLVWKQKLESYKD